jgi:hypothetical protein
LILAIGNFATTGIIGVNQDYNKTLVLSNSKEAVGIVARQIRLAKSVVSSNSLDDAHAPGAPGNLNSWNGAAGTGTALILEVPSHTAAGAVIYADGLHAILYTDEVIFYLDSSTKRLYKRVLANSSAPGNVTKTTCPPASATSLCPADADVVDDVASLTTSYLTSAGGTPLTPSGTEAVNYTVTETRVINGKSYSGTYSTIATLRNK